MAQNIVWEDPVGNIHVTTLGDEMVALQQWGASHVELLLRKGELKDILLQAEAQEKAIGVSLTSERLKESSRDEAVRLGATARIGQFQGNIDALRGLMKQTAGLLETISRIEEVKATFGFSEDEYTLILKQRDYYRGFTCVGHNLQLPTDRTFRAALKNDGGKLTHDMPKCRTIAEQKLGRKDSRIDAATTPEDLKAIL